MLWLYGEGQISLTRMDGGNAIIGLTEIEQACNAYELFQR